MDAAYTPMKLNNGNGTISNYGFGWELEMQNPLGKTVWHNGDNPGIKTMILRSLDTDKTLIVLCNNASDDFENLIKKLRQIIVQ